MLLGETLALDFKKYEQKQTWFLERPAIRKSIQTRLLNHTTAHWLDLLRKKGFWCEKVFDYDVLNAQSFMEDLQLKQSILHADSTTMVTTRCPIKIDGEILIAPKAAPQVGEDNAKINEQFKCH